MRDPDAWCAGASRSLKRSWRTRPDAFRRVGLAAGPCAGGACVLRAAAVIGNELGWSASQGFDAAREFLRGAWLGRAPILGRMGWAQEELAIGAHRGLHNLWRARIRWRSSRSHTV